MKKETLLLLSTLGISSLAVSQQLSPAVIASEGGISKNTNMCLEWTIGEFAVESISSARQLYTQGFHQPLLQTKEFPSTPTAPEPVQSYSITVAPNPVQSALIVNLRFQDEQPLVLALYDLSGRILSSRFISSRSTITQLDMSGMIGGIYLLQVRSGSGAILRSFQIIKAK